MNYTYILECSEYGVKRRIEDVHGGLMEYFTTNLH